MSQPNLPLISIIIPYYNCEKYITETLASVEAQTYPNIEVILVNDGSSKPSTAYIEALIQDKAYIQYLYQENKGVSSARNTGAKHAKGEFLLFLDADDLILPNYITQAVEIFSNHSECKLVYSKANFFEARNDEWILQPYTNFKNLLLGNHIPIFGLHKTEYFKNINGFDENLKSHEDWDYWIRLLQDGGEVIRIDEILFLYRKRFDYSSLSDQWADDKSILKEDFQNIYKKHINLFLKYNLSYWDLLSIYQEFHQFKDLFLDRINNLLQQDSLIQNNFNDKINIILDNYLEEIRSNDLLITENKELKAKLDSNNENHLSIVNMIKDLEKSTNIYDKHLSYLKDKLTEEVKKNELITSQFQQKIEEHEFLHEKIFHLQHNIDNYNNNYVLMANRIQQLEKLETMYNKSIIHLLLKPLYKIERNLHSLNRYRKGFRRLIKQKGSFGKAYQTVRRTYNKHGTKAAKQLLLQSLANHNLQKPVSYTETNPNYKPKISVIVPNYNHEKYIIERLDSILKQSYKNIELIILDDNSTDNSVETINNYLKNKDISYQLIINEQNAGNVFKQWKKGIELATGELIWICESDDTCEADFLQNIIPYFIDTSVNLAFGRIQLINQDGVIKDGLDGYRENAENGIWNKPCVRPAFQWFNNAFGVNNVYANASGGIFRRQSISSKIWEKACEFKICGDWYLYLHLAGSGKIAFSPTAISYFRQHDKNTSASNFNKLYYYKEHFTILDEILNVWNISNNTKNRFIEAVRNQYNHFDMAKTHGNFDDVFNTELNKKIERKSIHIQLYFLGFHTGGGELFPIVLANQLYELGYMVSMVALDLDNINKDMQQKLHCNIPVYHISILAEDKDFLKNAGVDIIHTHIAGADHHLIQYLGNNNLSVPYVVTMHGSHDRSFNDYSVESTEKMIHNVSKWVYIADKNLDFFQGFNVDNVIKFPNAMPIDKKESNHSRSSLGINETDIVFAFAARGIAEKGWIELVQAFNQLKEKNIHTAHLVLMGAGDAQQKAQKLVQNNSNIHFLGYESAVNGVLRFSDCLVLPSRFAGESYPLCLIQAIQEKLPCIATDIGEIRNMILSDNKEQAGILIQNTTNNQEFTKYLTDALIQMCNDELRLNYQKVSESIAHKYDMKRLAERYAELYKSVIKNENDSE